jgi:hypothetical protein
MTRVTGYLMAAGYLSFLSREVLRFCVVTLGSAWIVMCVVSIVSYSLNGEHWARSWQELIAAIVRSGSRLFAVVPWYCAAFVVAYAVVVSLGRFFNVTLRAIRLVSAIAFVGLTVVVLIGAALALYVEFGAAGSSAAILGALWYSLKGMRVDAHKA